MEYLMTYGWAVLIVGIIILLLMSLRVLDVDWWSVQNEVWMLSSFSISDFKTTPHPVQSATTSVLIFQLINNRGTNVSIEEIRVRDRDGNELLLGQGFEGIFVWYCDASGCEATPRARAFPFNMTPGERMIVNGTIGIPGDINTVFTTKIEISYNSPRSSQNHTDTGMMRGRIEPY